MNYDPARTTELLIEIKADQHTVLDLWTADLQFFSLEERMTKSELDIGALATVFLVAKQGVDLAMAATRLAQLMKKLFDKPTSEKRVMYFRLRLGSHVERAVIENELRPIIEKHMLDIEFQRSNEPAIDVVTSELPIKRRVKKLMDGEDK